jgi:hypothetical protein
LSGQVWLCASKKEIKGAREREERERERKNFIRRAEEEEEEEERRSYQDLELLMNE